MRFFYIQPDPGVEWGIAGPERLREGASLLSGRPVVASIAVPAPVAVNHPPDSTIGHLIGQSLPIISDALLQALLSTGASNLQSWPALLASTKGTRTWSGHHAINVVGIVDAVSMGRSRSTTIIGGGDPVPALVEFDEVILDGARTLGLRMFRVPESPALWFIDEGVFEGLRRLRPPGGWGVYATEVRVV